MSLNDRLTYLILGCLIGFVVGYVVRSLRDIKEELDEVDDMVKDIDNKRKRDERGIVRTVLAMRVSLALVVILTAFAAFQSQQASNSTESQQKQMKIAQAQLEQVTQCNKTVLRQALVALNERTTYSEAQVNANVDLQTSFAELLTTILHQLPSPDKKRTHATHQYYQDLTNFVSVADKTKAKQRENPFPTDEQLNACLQQ